MYTCMFCYIHITYSLVVQLARDLQSDFYPHFKEFFSIITSLLRIQDASLIEVSNLLHCLTLNHCTHSMHSLHWLISSNFCGDIC